MIPFGKRTFESTIVWSFFIRKPPTKSHR